MTLTFQKATKKQARARIALIGPSGSGKTYTGLTFAASLGGRVAVIDTERGSASKYSDLFAFDVLELDEFSPATYVKAIHAAEQAGYDVLLIDSLSHAWAGEGGALEMVDKAAARSNSNNSYVAWRNVTPEHNRLVNAMLGARMHVVVTMRAKTAYVLETNKNGQQVPRKIGMAPIQRDGLEYEFDLVADLAHGLELSVSKTRCPAMHELMVAKPDAATIAPYQAWLGDGQQATEPASPAAAAPEESPALLAGGREDGDPGDGEDWFGELLAEIGPDATESRAHAALVKHSDFQDLRVKDWRSVLAGYDDDRAQQAADVLIAKFRGGEAA